MTPTITLRGLAERCLPSNADLDILLDRGGPVRIETVNLHHLYLARTDPQFRDALKQADLITADGWPIVRLLSPLNPTIRRVTGSDLIGRIVDGTAIDNRRIGLLGASPQAGRKFSEILSQRSNNELAFADHRSREDWVVEEICDAAVAADVELLLVAVSPPFGEVLAAAIRSAQWDRPIINVGGGVDMAVAEQARAPEHWQRFGAEWAHRLLSDPRRLWRRYLMECLPTFFRMYRASPDSHWWT